MNDAELIQWRNETDLPRIQALIDEHILESEDLEAEFKEFQKNDDLNQLYNHVIALEELQKELRERQERMKLQEGRPELAVYLGLNKRFFIKQYAEYQKHKREVYRLQHKLYGIGPKTEKSKNGVTDEMIARAKEYPMENLVEVSRGMALCLWHDDHNPSMLVKNNFAHCFSCHRTADVIDVYRILHGATFPEAVKALAGV